MTLEELEAQGFDMSESDGEGAISVRCSCCAALVINGVPAHETGCPNQRKECRWCGSLAPAGMDFCDEACYGAYHNLPGEDEEEEPEEEEATYCIKRFRQNGGSTVFKTGLTLEEAQEWCSRDDTSGDGWFDGYCKE